nr:reverse transcriptase domain-containing protein [Tanacetum cinerariifolium]
MESWSEEKLGFFNNPIGEEAYKGMVNQIGIESNEYMNEEVAEDSSDVAQFLTQDVVSNVGNGYCTKGQKNKAKRTKPVTRLEPIALISIQATDFGLRHHMIQQVQNTCQFHRLPSDDTNRHINKFLEITQHMKQNGVFDDALRLSLFPYSLKHHAIAWYDRLPRNSVHSFDDMMRKFLSKYFPPSMVTKLRNEITKFEQKPHESLFEAWERYKLLIDWCPNHKRLLVTQINTFYNGLTLSHRDTINAKAGGTFMQKTPKECYKLIENMIAHQNHWDTSATRDEMSRNISSTSTTESPEVVR